MNTNLLAIYEIGLIVSQTHDLRNRLMQILDILHNQIGLQHGVVALQEQQGRALTIFAMHTKHSPQKSVHYKKGEGILGWVLDHKKPIIIDHLADEPRFLDRLKIYDQKLPLLAQPIMSNHKEILGILAAQPVDKTTIKERQQLLEMTANLIAAAIQRIHETEGFQHELLEERDSLRRKLRTEYGFDNMVGHSPAMRHVFEQIRQVSKWNTTVLIRGESGTGKELIANAVHFNSSRAAGPLIKLNCAALPDNLLESELFGHEKGAFTGAVSQKPGRFERAAGGTLFLDELGEISPSFQAKLLRVLQDGEFERLGGTQTLKADVRLIAATNKDLENAVLDGSFREDLYYRLNVMPIQLPSLKERIGDIPDLVNHLLKKIGSRQQRELSISKKALSVLAAHDWPGNVRELENCLERAAIMSPSGTIESDAISIPKIRAQDHSLSSYPTLPPVVPTNLDDPSLSERERVIAALEQSGWVQAKAARILNMTPRQIAYRIQRLKIQVRQI